MQPEPSITNVAHVIQLAVAPVFLLTGVGAVLSVLAARLARIVDRLRLLSGDQASGGGNPAPELDCEKVIFGDGARLTNWAISLCTVCALLICTAIAALFIGSPANVSLSGTIAMMFIAAMLALIVGLIFFLREIYLATYGVNLNARWAAPHIIRFSGRAGSRMRCFSTASAWRAISAAQP